MPTITYDCQTWSINKQLTNKLRTAQRAMERKMLNLKLQGKIPCSEIRKRTKIIIIIIMIIIIIIIIAFKGAIRDFLQSPHSAANCLQHVLKWPGRNRVQITCNTSNAYHVQVSCYVPLGTKGQLSY